MRYFLIFPAFMVLAMLVRFIGWLLWVKDWIGGAAESESLLDALTVGLPRGWAMVAPFFVGGLQVVGTCVLTCTLLLGMPILWASVLRRKPPVVFISYHRSRQALAEQLSTCLAESGIVVRFLPFDPDATHDMLLQRVDAALADARYLVCLPGVQGSFVDAEVLAAAATHKSIIFVIDHPDGSLPNTGAKRYPVLMTQALVAQRFAPLSVLLLYLHGAWRETLALYALQNAPVPWIDRLRNTILGVVCACMMLAGSVLWFGGLTAYALEHFFPLDLKVTVMVVMVVAITLLLGVGLLLWTLELLANGVSGIIRRQRAVAAARHAIRSGQCTGIALRAAFAPADKGVAAPAFLAALWPDRPPAHHELGR